MGVFHLGLAGPDNVAANPLPHPKFQHLNAHNIVDRDDGPRHRGTQLHLLSGFLRRRPTRGSLLGFGVDLLVAALREEAFTHLVRARKLAPSSDITNFH